MSLVARVSALLGEDVASAEPLQGGDLSQVHLLTLADGCKLVTKQSALAEAEAAMLHAIREAGAPAPEVLASQDGLLVMEWIGSGGSLASAWDDLARVMAILHSCHGAHFGWPDEYAFGAVEIANSASEDWPTFWAERRLLCHLPHLPVSLARRVERLGRALPDFLPRMPVPSLLHGDLWGGNILVCDGAVAALVDPACYRGDCEVDVAMLTLFDHPPDRFFDALDLEPGWRERQGVYSLWPWLVHLRLFGSGYRPAVDSCLAELGF